MFQKINYYIKERHSFYKILKIIRVEGELLFENRS